MQYLHPLKYVMLVYPQFADVVRGYGTLTKLN